MKTFNEFNKAKLKLYWIDTGKEVEYMDSIKKSDYFVSGWSIPSTVKGFENGTVSLESELTGRIIYKDPKDYGMEWK